MREFEKHRTGDVAAISVILRERGHWLRRKMMGDLTRGMAAKPAYNTDYHVDPASPTSDRARTSRTGPRHSTKAATVYGGIQKSPRP